MSKHEHEFRDPIHVFVRMDENERRVVDSIPFQRLRHIHQLALTSMIYPAATHKRFEHSLGVMELAGRVFDVVTNPARVSDAIRKAFPELQAADQLAYWRKVVRLAALCHDVGHLPFSHAAEKELLPTGWDHERLTREIVRSKYFQEIFREKKPTIDSSDVEKLAVGPRKAKDLTFSNWETMLSEIIVGDAFGVDRMDYLLRDSYHLGVSYGRFDHFRLIDTLRIVSTPESEELAPSLGVEEGGMHSAEALLLGRYYMYSQVYFHPIRRIYDIHLKDFLKAWLPQGQFPTDVDSLLKLTDNEVYSSIHIAARNSSLPGHDAASRVAQHQHYKLLYRRNPDDVRRNPAIGLLVQDAAEKEFGTDAIRRDVYEQKRDAVRFPVLLHGDRVGWAEQHSEVLSSLPLVKVDFVYVRPELLPKAETWLRANLSKLLNHPPKEE